MAEHLSPLDAMFLELEQADESAHMHIGAVAIFDPAPDGVPTLDDLAARLEQRMGLLPRFSQRLSATRTGGLAWPVWEPAPRFDVRDHLRRAALPSPGGETELLEWTADFYSHRLDRSRPLWETVLLEGLPGGRWAIASKSHHCLVDGISSVDVGYALMDGEPPVRRTNSRRAPRARRALPSALHPREVLSRTRAVVEMLIRDELIAAPATSLNQPIGGTRRYRAVRVRLSDLRAIKDALGGTINDVVMAVSAAGLRRLLLSRGEELPPAGLRAQVPVNLRSADDELALGNRLTSLYVHLPVTEADTLGLYRRVVAEAQHRKRGTQALGGRTIVEITNHAPPVLHSMLAESLFDVRLFNLTITNVPASSRKICAFGAPLREVLPLVPLFARHAVGIAAVSYGRQMVFGLNADRATVPDLDVLANGIGDAVRELRGAAGRGSGHGRTRRRTAPAAMPVSSA